ncbi:hypothetical protein HKBW3S43_01658, partial [Candidatus Hakubella thermalkaliphila]
MQYSLCDCKYVHGGIGMREERDGILF